MTKKDYIAIAKVIDGLDEFNFFTPSLLGTLVSKVDLIRSLIELFQADNPRFDAGKFSEACQKTDRWIEA